MSMPLLEAVAESLPRPHSVRPLTDDDRAAFLRLVARNPVRCQTTRLNQEVFGFNSEKIKNWGAFDENGQTLAGVLSRFGNTVVAVDENGACASLFAITVDNETGLAGMRGSAEVVAAIGQKMCRYAPKRTEPSHFLQLERPVSEAVARSGLARRASLSDLENLVTLYGSAGVMYRSRTNLISKLTYDRVFVAERYCVKSGMNRIVSCALTNVEGADTGIIGGVFTLPEMRGRGFGKAVTAALAYDLQQDGKLPCLYYENPIAGRVYHHLGFVKRDEWAVSFFRVVNPPRRQNP